MEIEYSVLERFAKMTLEERDELVKNTRRRVAKSLISSKPKFVEFTTRGRSRRVAVHIHMTKSYYLRDPDDNNCIIGTRSASALASEIADGVGDFFALK